MPPLLELLEELLTPPELELLELLELELLELEPLLLDPPEDVSELLLPPPHAARKLLSKSAPPRTRNFFTLSPP